MADNHISALAAKYREAKESNKSIYLDAHEFDSLADYFDEQGTMSEAREAIEDGLAIHPKNPSLLIKKAKFALYDGDYTYALKLLRENTAYDFDIALIRIECFLNLDFSAEAFDLVKEIIEEEDDDLENAFAEIGFIYLDADFYKDAILYFEKSLGFNPENNDVLRDLAYAYEMIGNHDKAIETSNRALDVNSYNYDAWVNLGRLYSLKEDYEKAVDAFDFALTIRNDDINIYKLKGHCLSLCDRIDEAIETFETILEENPDETSVYFLLAECYQALDQLDKALEILEKYESPSEGTGLEYIAKKIQILLQADRVEIAEKCIEVEITKGENLVELHIVAAEIKIHKGEFDQAEAYLLEVLKENEDDFHLLNMLSVLNIKRENYIQAIKYTEMLIDIAPTHLEIKERLALLYFEIDDTELFNSILEQFTDNELRLLFHYIYIPKYEDLFNREELLFHLNEARERRALFKNLEY